MRQDLVRSNADLLRSTGLQAKGYTYVNLDASWASRERDNTTKQLVPNRNFRGIADGSLAQYLNSQGFPFTT